MLLTMPVRNKKITLSLWISIHLLNSFQCSVCSGLKSSSKLQCSYGVSMLFNGSKFNISLSKRSHAVRPNRQMTFFFCSSACQQPHIMCDRCTNENFNEPSMLILITYAANWLTYCWQMKNECTSFWNFHSWSKLPTKLIKSGLIRFGIWFTAAIFKSFKLTSKWPPLISS